MIKISTKRLLLCNVNIDYLNEYHLARNSEFVLKYNMMEKSTMMEDYECLLKQNINDNEIMIINKETNEFIGMIYISKDRIRYRPHTRDLSYWLAKEHAQKGYMKEALNALINYLFQNTNIELLGVRVFADNIASLKLMESLGFQLEGRLRKAIYGLDEKYHDDLLFSLFKDEYKKG